MSEQRERVCVWQTSLLALDKISEEIAMDLWPIHGRGRFAGGPTRIGLRPSPWELLRWRRWEARKKARSTRRSTKEMATAPPIKPQTRAREGDDDEEDDDDEDDDDDDDDDDDEDVCVEIASMGAAARAASAQCEAAF
jgi:phosphopantothenoylcysteine synthetase/decarboxylase